ncbi:hypothetical protein KFL_001410270 [Klebsormidium nitens]|uniref:Uncharacterized protein n=1 Tax=Klebsormidium nitens TaxID=105231 RepID=A0A0U9HJS7_KLENI|nr:hypothetical protein KFL_001410270 [Klebsormidium nitens]|eukprot:GAQ83270.1 hypothetical protein KFL_001410270 [Klebsormidium nitens]
MAFLSFVGRTLFVAIFLVAAVQKASEYGADGGKAAELMRPKLDAFYAHVQSNLHVALPVIEAKYLLAIAIGLEFFGGLLFWFGSSLGAWLLLLFLVSVTPIMHDFYNQDVGSTEQTIELIQFMKNLSLTGALLFFLGLKSSVGRASRRNRSKVVANKPKVS